MIIHPLEPIVDEKSKILILGSFPSEKSRYAGCYYGHPRNQFWKLLSSVFDVTLTTQEEKYAFCLSHTIALWDVIASCEAQNSLDSSLRYIQPHPLKEFLAHYPTIHTLVFTSQFAYKQYKKFFPELSYRFFILPSPSPAHAAQKFEEKLTAYRHLREWLN